MLLASEYSPNNVYCYALDSASSTLFHKQMRALADCFPNVMLTDKEFDMDSEGKNMDKSLWECLKVLSKFKWKYVIFLQVKNFDILNNLFLELRCLN